jgi:hypothetical protein
MGCDESPKIQRALHANKPQVLALACIQWSILNGQEDLGVAGSGCVVNTIALRVVKGEDGEISEVHPTLVEVSAPIAQNSLDGQARIKLSAKCINYQPQIGGEVLEGGFIHLKSMRTLVNGHRGRNLWVQLDGHATNWNVDQIKGDESHFVNDVRILGGRHCHSIKFVSSQQSHQGRG